MGGALPRFALAVAAGGDIIPADPEDEWAEMGMCWSEEET